MTRPRLAVPGAVDFEARLRQLEAEHGRPRPAGAVSWEEHPQSREARLSRSGLELPEEDRDAILHDRLGATLALDKTKAFATGRDSFLLLSGPTGRGKTLACAWLLAERGGYCVTGPKLVRLQASAGFDRSSRDQLDNLHAAHTVLLDELARDDDLQKHEKTAVFELINARVGAGKRTLVTTNRAPLYLHKRYESFVYNRLTAQGNVVLLEGEPDLRALRAARRRS